MNNGCGLFKLKSNDGYEGLLDLVVEFLGEDFAVGVEDRFGAEV
jgi:hypothetical protein